MDTDCRVERALAQTEILAAFLDGTEESGRLWIGFSGGVDSTVLLHALRSAPRAVAIHIDHGLTASASEWVRHCAAAAREIGVAFESRSVRVAAHGNTENAARQARYGVWEALLTAGDTLALAHHGDDQAETRVWQLLTGRHPGGMPSVRRLGAGKLVRPLLGVRRRDILDYANRHGLRWVEDPSNADLDLDRNLIRHRVMPRLEARHPGATVRLRARRPAPATCLRALAVAEASEQGVLAWLLAAGLPTPAKAVAEIRRQSSAAQDRNPQIRVVPGISARRYANAWHLVADRAGTAQPRSVAVRPGRVWEDLCGTLSWHRAETGLPGGLALSVRRRQGGERIRARGRDRTKTVKALFQEARIPPWQRPGWPLLYAGEDLVAVPNLAVADGFPEADGWVPRWTPRQPTV